MKSRSRTPKYKTYTELAEAFQAGELPGYFILMDKGGSECRLLWGGQGDDDKHDEMNSRARELFNGDGDREPIEALFAALGIPAEWA